MNMKPVHSSSAPAAIGPYSQAIVHHGVVYCSGQIALDPAAGQLVGKTAAEQAARALDNLAAVLTAAGSGLQHVLRTTVYLVAMADFAAVNEVYGQRFGAHKPARATVAVKELPKGALVEIDCIAVSP